MTQTVLVVGCTGMLGGRIAHHLLAAADAKVRLLVRPGTLRDPEKAGRLAPLLAGGAETVDADLADGEELRRALRGPEVVISALQGGPEIIVDAQVALAEAARASGVRRILPSDFAVDLFRAPEGEHALLDMRRRADVAIAASGLEHVHVLNGAFMDVLLSPYLQLFDEGSRTLRYWGEGDERFDATSVEDTARYAAAAALDRELPSGPFAVAGQQISAHDMADAYELATGRKLRRERRGSARDLEAWIERTRATDPDPMAAIPATYQLFMITGRTALRDLRNERYPDIRPESFLAFLRRTGAGQPASGEARS